MVSREVAEAMVLIRSHWAELNTALAGNNPNLDRVFELATYIRTNAGTIRHWSISKTNDK